LHDAAKSKLSLLRLASEQAANLRIEQRDVARTGRWAEQSVGFPTIWLETDRLDIVIGPHRVVQFYC